MDLGIIAAVAMLALWGIAALGFSGPGWIHLLLIGGVFLLLQRIVARSDNRPRGR